MAIALVKSNLGLSTTATTNPSFSTAPTSGNLIVLGFAGDDYNGTPDTGWTQSTGMEQQTFHGGYLWWRISDGSNPPGSYTIGSATTSSWVLAEFSGCDASPYDTSLGTLIQSSGGTMATSSLVPTTGNRVLVAMVGGNSAVVSMAGTYDSWTNSFTAILSNGQSSGNATCTGLAYRLVTGDGSTSYTTTADYSGTAAAQARTGLIISFKELASVNTIMFADQARS